MIVLMVVALMAAALALRAPNREGDLPQRIVVAATRWLPAQRRVWGQALIAELDAVTGRGRRWRFAAGATRIALFPPAVRPATARATAAVGAMTTVAATVAAIRLLPSLAVFVATLGLLMTAYATAIAGRWRRVSSGRLPLAAAGMTLTGVLAVIAAVVSVAVTHPAATRDQTHIFSVVLAMTLCGYLIGGGSAVLAGGAERATLWGGLAGSTAAVAASTLLSSSGAVEALVAPITVVATVATAAVVGLITGSRTAAARAGLLTALISAPIHAAMTIIAAQYAHPTTLASPYDIAAFPRSGYPDITSYLLSDAVAGNIIALAATPLIAYALAVAAAEAARLRPSR